MVQVTPYARYSGLDCSDIEGTQTGATPRVTTSVALIMPQSQTTSFRRLRQSHWVWVLRLYLLVVV